MVEDRIALSEMSTRLIISRVPKKTRLLFIQLSEEEFEKDYGMTLKWCLEQAFEYQNIKPLLFNLSQQSNNTEQEEESVKTFSGREVKGGKDKDGSTK